MSDSTDPMAPLDRTAPVEVAEPPEERARRRRTAVILGGVIAVVLVLLALVWIIGDDDETTGDTTTTSVDQTTTTGESTTTDGTTTITTVPLAAEPPLRTDAVSGSGCTPGSGALPEGWWFGTVDPPVDRTMAFDLACYYLGDAAEEVAASRDDEVNNDYYVVNDSTVVRSVPVALGTTASCVSLGSGVSSEDCAPGDVAGDWSVWIRVHGGAIDRIVEQYAP
jgi:hypothetical protein